ncbi:MAG: D-alanyl-D-alanine carboxypeptidase family protein [Christensenellales bacterium]|jgi:D-alanyl-D-alanine carboxypeptidase (penicillin-binding protein 5/6)
MTRKTIRCILAIVMVLCIITAMPPPAKAAPEEATSSAAVVLETGTNRVLFESNPDAQMPMASTTKIMTALVALEHGNLDDKVVIPREAVGIEGSSIYLKEGEVLSLEQLLYGLMLSSGNDVAVAVACHVGGSVEGFVDMMNTKAMKIGAENTCFTNPNGLHDDNHYTTAYDLALITSCALKNPEFQRICSTQYKEIPGPEGTPRTLKNKNKLLWQYEGGNGVKTGYTKAAGKCLVASAKREDMQVVCVVLNSSSMFIQSMALMDEAFECFDNVPVLSEGEPLGTIPVEGANVDSVTICMDEEIRLPLTKEEEDEINVRVLMVPRLKAPVEAGLPVGRLEVFIGETKVMEMGINLEDTIPEKAWGDWLHEIVRGWRLSNILNTSP